MAILFVGPTSPHASIAQAMAFAVANDTIQLESGYSNETATVSHGGMTFQGDASSTGIVLQLGIGVAVFTTAGAAPFEIRDAIDANGIVGNAGANLITVSGGIDAVDAGLGVDRLVVDYRLATGAVTGNSTSNFTEAGGGGRSVTVTDGTIEHFTVLTGAGADTITTGAGDDIIAAGDGANTISAGQGTNTITGGNEADTITALDGGNIIDGGNGTNVLTSGAGADIILSGTGADTIVAGAGADVVTVRGGADTVDAGAGTDRLIVDYSAMTTNVSGGITGGNFASGYVGQLADLVAATVNFQGVEHFTITTGSGNDTVTTGDGDDVLDGGAGDDVLNAGAGNDRVRAGTGNDILDGGAGTDTLVYTGQALDYTVVDNGDGTSTITDNRVGSPDGTDTVTGFEGLHFNSPPSGAVTIAGIAAQGQVLTAANTLADTDGLGPISYRWQADGVDIPGATGTSLVLQAGQVGQAITAIAFYVDLFGVAESVASAPTGPVVFDLTAPTVAAVLATPADAVLGYGATVSLSMRLSEAVSVDTAGGVPTLALNNGGLATYASGSGSDALLFSYTVGSGQDTADLTVAAVNLNGAAIADLAGNAASLGGAVVNPAGTLAVVSIAAYNVTTDQAIGVVGTAYVGPVGGIDQEYIRITPDNVNVTAATGNWFIHTGAGNDAIAVTSGTNVLDGSTGSNFLTGGSGADTFFVDARGAVAASWNTIVNFQTGDTATIWGATPESATFSFVDGQGAGGFTGLTLHATAEGMPTASLTFAGLSMADFTSGHLTQMSGFDEASGSTYTTFQAVAG